MQIFTWHDILLSLQITILEYYPSQCCDCRRKSRIHNPSSM